MASGQNKTCCEASSGYKEKHLEELAKCCPIPSLATPAFSVSLNLWMSNNLEIFFIPGIRCYSNIHLQRPSKELCLEGIFLRWYKLPKIFFLITPSVVVRWFISVLWRYSSDFLQSRFCSKQLRSFTDCEQILKKVIYES